MHTCSRKSCTTPVFLSCQTAIAMSMLRRLFFGLPLWSPKVVGRFTPPHSWSWQHKFAPVSAGFAHRPESPRQALRCRPFNSDSFARFCH